jgi:hypothetical protein
MTIFPGQTLLIHGHHEPLRRQINYLKRHADDSFCAHLDLVRYPSFMDNVPSLSEGLYFDDTAPMLLKLRNVEPHIDTWVGNHPIPTERLALFWLLWIKHWCYFGVEGSKATCLKSGDFVVFDDSKEHYLMSSTQWVGVSWQLRRQGS